MFIRESGIDLNDIFRILYRPDSIIRQWFCLFIYFYDLLFLVGKDDIERDIGISHPEGQRFRLLKDK